MSQATDKIKLQYLQTELSNARQKHLSGFEFPEPDAVRAARAVLNAFDTRVNKARNRQRLAVSTAADKIREVILFGDNQKALDAIRKYEKRVFK